jgi:hypothetical protein
MKRKKIAKGATQEFKSRHRKVRVMGICYLQDCPNSCEGKTYYCETHAKELRRAQTREAVSRYYRKAQKGNYRDRFVTPEGTPTEHAVKYYKQTMRLLREGYLKLSETQDVTYRQVLAEALNPHV